MAALIFCWHVILTACQPSTDEDYAASSLLMRNGGRPVLRPPAVQCGHSCGSSLHAFAHRRQLPSPGATERVLLPFALLLEGKVFLEVQALQAALVMTTPQSLCPAPPLQPVPMPLIGTLPALPLPVVPYQLHSRHTLCFTSRHSCTAEHKLSASCPSCTAELGLLRSYRSCTAEHSLCTSW